MWRIAAATALIAATTAFVAAPAQAAVPSYCEERYPDGTTQYQVVCHSMPPDGGLYNQYRARATCYKITNETTWVWRYGPWKYLYDGWSVAYCPSGYEAAPPGTVQFRYLA